MASWLNEVDVGCGMKEVNKNLELRASVLLLKVGKMRSLFNKLRIHLSLYLDLDFLFDLYNNVSIDGLPLVNGSVFVELKNNGNLGFVGHGENESFGDVFVVHVLVECHSMEPDAFLIKVNCIFASGHCQIHVQ